MRIKIYIWALLLLMVFTNTSYADANLDYEIIPANVVRMSKNYSKEVRIVLTNKLSETVILKSLVISSSCDFYVDPQNTGSLLGTLPQGATNLTVDTLSVVYKGTGSTLKFTLTYTTASGDKTLEISTNLSTNPEKEKEYIEIDTTPKDYAPNITVSVSKDADLNFTPKQNFDLEVTLKNNAKDYARDIKVSLVFDNAPLNWRTYNGAIEMGTIYAYNEKKTTLRLRVNDNAKKGLYPLKIEIKYTDDNGKSYTNTDSIYINITEELTNPLLVLSNIAYDKDVIAGEDFNLFLTFKNEGGFSAKGVKFKLEGLGKDHFIPKEANDIKLFDVIKAGASQEVRFLLAPSTKIENGLNELKVAIEYTDDNDKSYTETKTIYVNVKSGNETDDSKSTPKIIITSYSTSIGTIKAGNTFNLNFSFQNTNGSKSIRNLRAKITPEGSVFSLTKGSNSFYVEKLDAKQSAARSIELRTKADAVSNSYAVSIAFDYEDADGASYSTTEIINIPVAENLKMVIDNLSVPPMLFIEVPTSINFEYYNMGKAKMSNLNVSVRGDFEPKNQMNYVGNIEAGKNDYYDIEIVPKKSGNVNGVLVLSFEDSNGEVIEVEKPFSAFVAETEMNDQPIDMLPTPIIMEKKGISRWLLGLSVIATFLLATFISRGITISRINKKLEEEI